MEVIRDMDQINWVASPIYNNFGLTNQFVNDALNQDINTNVLIWDNGSKEVYLHSSPRVYIVRSDENIGVGPAWNQICGLLFGGILGVPPAEHILLCNNDIRIRPDTYRNILIPSGGFVTPINVGDWEKAVNANFLVEPEPYSKGGPDFSCFLIHKWFYELNGPFPECYLPAFFEDNEYHWVAKCNGLDSKIYSVAFPYYHIGSQTLKNNEDIRKINDVNFIKNRELYQARWGGLPGHETFTIPYGFTNP